MALQFVGGKTFTAAGANSNSQSIPLTNLTGGLASSPSADDYVIVTVATGSAADRALGIATAGYGALIAEQYANGSTTDTNFCVYAKMLTSAETSVSVNNSGSTADALAVAIEVWRGVDPGSPMDVAAATATGTGTGRPNPPAVTPVTSGAVVVACGGAGAATGAVFTASGLSNFQSATSADNNDAMVGMGSAAWTSGTLDPAAWTGGTTGAGDSWAAATLALRPLTSTNGSGSGAPGETTASAPDGSATGNGSGSGDPGATTASAPAGTGVGAGSGSGSLSAVTAAAPEGTGGVAASGSGDPGQVSATAPDGSGTATGSGQADAPASSATAPVGQGTGDASGSGSLVSASATASDGNASGDGAGSAASPTASAEAPAGSGSADGSGGAGIGPVGVLEPSGSGSGAGTGGAAIPEASVVPPQGGLAGQDGSGAGDIGEATGEAPSGQGAGNGSGSGPSNVAQLFAPSRGYQTPRYRCLWPQRQARQSAGPPRASRSLVPALQRRRAGR